jgi:hypothetical protein
MSEDLDVIGASEAEANECLFVQFVTTTLF